jgi:MFS transporter, DHA3 family, macrolide efflux protein
MANATKTTRNLWLLLQGQFVTHMGNQIYDIAILLWIKETTGKASLMGLALLLTNLPNAVLGPLGGKLADRFGRVRTMVTADLVSAFAVGLVALSLWWRAEPLVIVLALAAGNLVLGIASACFDPAVLALIPALTPGSHLAKGNAAHQSSRMGGQILGQGLAGVLVSALGIAGAFLVNALSFVVSAATGAAIRVPGGDAARRQATDAGSGTASRAPSLLGETIAMLRGVLRQPDLRALLLYVAAFHLCLSCLPVLLPFYAQHALSLSDRWFGFFVAAYTIGILAGFGVAGSLPPPASRFRLVATVGLAVGALFGATALARSYLLAWPLLLAIGVGIGIIVVNLMTELQIRSPEGERGGIMGAAEAVGGTTFPLGMALTGVLLDAMASQGLSYAASTRTVLGISAAGCVVVAVAAIRASRSADDHGRQTR